MRRFAYYFLVLLGALAFVAGGFVGAYTVTDALGARSAGSPNSYMVWVTLLYAVLVAGAFATLQRGNRAHATEGSWRTGVIAGLELNPPDKQPRSIVAPIRCDSAAGDQGKVEHRFVGGVGHGHPATKPAIRQFLNP